MAAPVLFHEKTLSGQARYGIATLNQPDRLNSLSLDMCRLLAEQLARWEKDPEIIFVLLDAAGEKAFCAGGDLHQLYESMLHNTGKAASANAHAVEFFDVEYRLDFQIHTYAKPIVCWGHGVVMGGGIGLMAGASHRVVSEVSRLAMPEVTIGLFPDVGGSWLLNRLPGKTGKFLAATGAILNASDALFSGMADYCVPQASWADIQANLALQSWASADSRDRNDEILHQMLNNAATQSQLATGPLAQHYDLINQLCTSRDTAVIYQNIAALDEHPDPWLARAAQTMKKGAPLSVAMGLALQEQARHLSLADVFRLEYNVAINCCAQGQLQEGIRALLIDKDKTPHWKPATIAEATPDLIGRMLASPWEQAADHPLAIFG